MLRLIVRLVMVPNTEKPNSDIENRKCSQSLVSTSGSGLGRFMADSVHAECVGVRNSRRKRLRCRKICRRAPEPTTYLGQYKSFDGHISLDRHPMAKQPIPYDSPRPTLGSGDVSFGIGRKVAPPEHFEKVDDRSVSRKRLQIEGSYCTKICALRL